MATPLTVIIKVEKTMVMVLFCSDLSAFAVGKLEFQTGLVYTRTG